MTQLHLQLSDAIGQYIEEQVATCGYGDASEYVRDLVENDRRRTLRQRVEAQLQEGLTSGDPIPVTPAFWESKRQEWESK